MTSSQGNNAGGPTRWDIWLGAIFAGASAIAALFGQLKDWPWRSPVVSVVLGGVALLGGIGCIVRAYRVRIRVLMAFGVVLLVLGSAALGLAWRRPSPSRVDSQLVYPNLKIKIDPPGNRVNFCGKFGGTGTIPDGFELVLFDKSSGDPDEAFAFHEKAQKLGNRWLSPEISLGDNPIPGPDRSVGLKVELHAQLVDQGLYNALLGIVAIDGAGKPVVRGYWKAQTLPGINEDVLEVERGPGQGDADC